MNIFNKLLRNDPTYVNVKDNSKLLQIILLTTKANYVKLKFGKYKLMDQTKPYFYKAQRLFHILSRFVQKLKTRKYKVFNIDYDFRMAPFETKTAIELVENGRVYKFNIYDLINIISASLYQQIHMFINPQFPKNPFTNINFAKHNIYNIYIKCIELKITIPEIIILFYKSDFNIDLFKEKSKMFLIESSIENYFAIDLSVTGDIIEYIYDMCEPHGIKIHEDFPQKELYSIFRPYLKCYFKSKLIAVDTDIVYLLDCFELYNPFFGKKYITDSNNEIDFDNRHLPFNEIKNGVFKTIKNTSTIMLFMANKYKYDDHYCISLQPIDNVTYVDVYEDDDIYDIYDEDSGEDYDF
jgi:hypothetical protein